MSVDWKDILIGAGLLAFACWSLATGNAEFVSGKVRRSENPLLYWAAVLLSGGLGLALILASFL